MIFQADMNIKAAIELGLEDLRKNEWLIDDIFAGLMCNPYLADKYGQKQIDACKQWFKNNEIDIYMSHRNDRDRFPCITITLGDSQEKSDMKTMADISTQKVILMPNQIGKPIPYVIKPFDISYDSMSGEVSVNPDLDISFIAPEMILVDPNTGNGYPIIEVIPDGFLIEPNLTITATKLGIVPKYQYYEARVEHTFFQETYQIGCHAHGDPQTLLWLHSIVLYSLLRYREGLLEAGGFTESVLASSDMLVNHISSSTVEEVFTRYITLTGQVENTWIKSPRRYIESIALREKTEDGYKGGIKIISNLDSPEFLDTDSDPWTTIEE